MHSYRVRISLLPQPCTLRTHLPLRWAGRCTATTLIPRGSFCLQIAPHPFRRPNMTPDDMGACLLTVIAVLLIHRVHPSVIPLQHPSVLNSAWPRPDTPMTAPPLNHHKDPSLPFRRGICLTFQALAQPPPLFLIPGCATPLNVRCTFWRRHQRW
jgi:hypothetical protein